MLPGLHPYSLASLFQLLCTPAPGGFHTQQPVHVSLFWRTIPRLWVPLLSWHTKNHKLLGIYSSWQVGGAWWGQPVTDWHCGAIHMCVCMCVVINIPASWSDEACGTHTISPTSPTTMDWATLNLPRILAWYHIFPWHVYFPSLTFLLRFSFILGILLMNHFHTILPFRSALGNLV